MTIERISLYFFTPFRSSSVSVEASIDLKRELPISITESAHINTAIRRGTNAGPIEAKAIVFIE
jgi:hypothetical protein